MGFNKEAIINAGIPNDSLSRTKVDLLRNELYKVPGIEHISFSMNAPADNGGWYTDLRTTNNKSNNPDMIVAMKGADTGYFRLYNLQLVSGRIYFPSDTMREFVVNETVVKNLGIKNPQDAIGKLINVNGKTFIAAMENIWNKNFPDYVFEYHFLDQSIADYYKQENQLSQLYKIFSGIAIFISCLGLYGLISFMAVQRKKEIGI